MEKLIVYRQRKTAPCGHVIALSFQVLPGFIAEYSGAKPLIRDELANLKSKLDGLIQEGCPRCKGIS